MTPPPDREVAVFNAARLLPAGRRVEYLDEACAADVAFRQRVEELLEASEEAGVFLDHPAPGAQRPDEEAGSPQPNKTIRISEARAEKTADLIGRYKLLQKLGEGGCGVVYLAEQEEPVRRRVALKVIKLGMDTRQVIARFEAERQALALMDHVNIAKVLEAGATETGRPFFVMELVRGIKVTDYCDQYDLSIVERLNLFVQICHAIQHAHQKGIIHRDIKPSNVLVALLDGLAVPKVIDFGIAKATDQRLTDKTLFTAFEQFIGTPAYMSPEQAEISALDIDTRSDIYSLGVLLYELLTGETPLDAKALVASGLEDMRRTIREKEPVRPSTRLSTMLEADLTRVARHRHSEPTKLAGVVRGDLDWIVMKALEKDRRRRYETANGLAMDVGRHLKSEPVVARPQSKIYQLHRLARRNKLAFASAGAVVTALLFGLGISTHLFVRARSEARNTRQVAGFFREMLLSLGPEVGQGRDKTMLVLDNTAERVGKVLKDQPAVEAEVRATLGTIFYDLGDYDRAEKQQVEALSLNQRVFGEESTNTASSLRDLASTLWDRGSLAEAEAKFRAALELRKKLLGPTDAQVAGTLNDLGLVLWTRGDLSEAKNLVSQALALRQKLLLPGDQRLVESLSDLGLVLWEQGELAESEFKLRGAQDLIKDIQGEEYQSIRAGALNNLGNVLLSQGRLAEAEDLYHQAMDQMKTVPKHPHVALIRSHLAVVIRRRAASSDDARLAREALELQPTDPLTADALACMLAEPFLAPLAPKSNGAPAPWRYTCTTPDSNWFATEFPDAAWSASAELFGFSTYSPRTDRAVTTHTNFWLRRSFELSELPAGKVVLRLNRSEDAEVFLNGIRACTTADWSDAPVLVACSKAAQSGLRRGVNVLAVHCQDVDGGTHVDVGLYVTKDSSLGRNQLIEQLSQMIGKEPEGANLYVGRANAFARLGKWREAVADLNQAARLQGSAQRYWPQLAPLRLETGDQLAYRQLRREALDAGSRPDSPSAAGRVCQLSLLLPAEGTELETAVNLAEKIAAPGNSKATLASRQFAKGLVDYRRGNFASAIEWARMTLETGARQDLPAWSHERERNRAVAAYLVKAMAHQQLNQAAEARTALSRANDIVQTQLSQPDSGDIGREWPDWLVAQILLREANGLIEAHPAERTSVSK
jgi:eukaryotic-like serine/threonine-protein kinase